MLETFPFAGYHFAYKNMSENKNSGAETPVLSPQKLAGIINSSLERAFPLLISLGVILGVVLPWVFIDMRSIVPFLFGTVTLVGALKLRVRELGKTIASPLPILLYFLTARVFMPLIVFAFSSLVFNNPDIVAGYVLLYAVPTAVTGFIWVSLYKGDPALGLTLILLDTIFAPIVVPATVRLLLGGGINLDMTGMIVSLTLMIVIPTIAGVALNESSRGKIPALLTPYLAPLSKLLMILVVAANASAVAPQIRFDNPQMWLIIAASVIFIVLSFFCARFAATAGKLNREKEVAFLFASSLRNSASAMTLAIRYFPEIAALPAVLGIMLQHNTAAVMGRIFYGKIGGSQAKGQQAK
jgi:tagaturonate reductase